MPTPVTRNRDPKREGKHWTQEELAARQTAEEELEREKRAYLRAPEWLSEDARAIWDETKAKLKGIQLLDNLDTAMLALYCDAVANYRQTSARIAQGNNSADTIKELQAWARLVISFSDKLGFTPGGRARLAKKKTEKVKDPFADAFGG